MNVEMGDVCDKLHNLIDIVGMKNFLEITKLYGGNRIYIPTYTKTTILSRNREIVKRYNGFNAQQLSYEYRVSTNQIKRIVNDECQGGSSS